MYISPQDRFRLIAVGFTSFVAVSIDEFFTLVVYFVQAKAQTNGMTVSNVIFGQLLGFTIIFLLSLLGTTFGYVLPTDRICLIGFVPLILGIYDLFKVILYWTSSKRKSGYSNLDDQNYQGNLSERVVSHPKCDLFAATLEPQISELDFELSMSRHSSEISSVRGFETSETNSDQGTIDSDNSIWWFPQLTSRIFRSYIHPNTLMVMLVILSEGGEEIAVFLPLFAISSLSATIFLLFVFYCLVGLQIFVAYHLVNFQGFSKSLSLYSKNFVPILLIGLGLYVLKDSVLFENE